MRQRFGWFLALALLSGCSFRRPTPTSPWDAPATRAPTPLRTAPSIDVSLPVA